MFKIGEFSRLTQVSIRMLRYYDENGLLKPAQIAKDSGYRLYSTSQIPRLNKIVFMRDLGFHTTEILQALNHWDDSFIEKQLEQKRLTIEKNIQAEQSKLTKIDLAKRDIRQDQITLHYNVVIKPVPGYQVLSLRRVIPDYYAEGVLWKEISTFAAENHVQISDTAFTIYHDPDYREKNVDVELCVPVLKTGSGQPPYTFRQTEAVPHMACTMVYGSFENIAGAYLSFAGWLEEHPQYQLADHSRQTVHRGPWNEENPENYLTEIQIPLVLI